MARYGSRIALASRSAFVGPPPPTRRLFTILARNALRATSYFDLPRERVVEIGADIEL